MNLTPQVMDRAHLAPVQSHPHPHPVASSLPTPQVTWLVLLVWLVSWLVWLVSWLAGCGVLGAAGM